MSSEYSNNEMGSNDVPAMSPKEEFEQLVELCEGEELSLPALKGMVEASSSEAVRSHGDGETLLHHVCFNRRVSLEMVQYLVCLYPDAVKHAKTGCSDREERNLLPLHRACLNEDCPSIVVEYLVALYPDALKISIHEPGMPLHCLTWGRPDEYILDVDLVRKLANMYPQALTNHDNYWGRTPLSNACYLRPDVSLELVQALVDEDYEAISIAAGNGDCPLHTIFERECVDYVTPHEVVQYLLEKAPDVIHRRNSSGDTPLHVACRSRNISFESMQLLVERSEPGLLNQHPYPLHLFTSWEWVGDQHVLMDIVEYFLVYSPDSLKISDRGGDLPLHGSCLAWSSKFNKVTKFLLRQYPDAVDAQNNIGELPIHCASRAGNIDLVSLLFEMRPNSVSAQTVSRDLPLHKAASWGHPTAVRFLMEKYAVGLQARDRKGNLPFHLVCEEMKDDNLSLVRDMLLAFPEAIHAKNFDGCLPLHLAYNHLWDSKENLIQFLVEQLPYGIRKQDSQARLPAHLACGFHGVSSDLLIKTVSFFPGALQVNSPTHGLPIHVACKNRLGLDIIKYLESMYPASLNVRNELLGLPLECAWAQEPFLYLLNKRYNQRLDQTRSLRVIFKAILNDDALRDKTSVASRLVRFCPSLACDLDRQGPFPLHQAAMSNVELSLVNELIGLNPSGVKKKDSTGRLPVHCSIHCDGSRVDIIAVLVEAFPRGVSATDHQSHLPLHVACRYGAPLQVVSLLTTTFLDGVRAKDQLECVPLHLACRHGSSIDVVKHLIERDETTLLMEDGNGDTHMHKACRGGHCNLVQYLVQRSPSLALKRNQSGLFPVLLLSQSNGKDPNIQDTPQYVETIWKLLLTHPECVKDALP